MAEQGEGQQGENLDWRHEEIGPGQQKCPGKWKDLKWEKVFGREEELFGREEVFGREEEVFGREEEVFGREQNNASRKEEEEELLMWEKELGREGEEDLAGEEGLMWEENLLG
jgi:hypothetical protein